MAAGTLPVARPPTIPQSTVLRLPWTAVPTRLGHRRIEEVGADRGRRMEAEQQHQQRSHQRAAADAGQADEHADQEAGERIERIVGGKDRGSPLFTRSKGMKLRCFALLEAALCPSARRSARHAGDVALPTGWYLPSVRT